MYQIIAGVPKNNNEGMHNPKYIVIDEKLKAAEFFERQAHAARKPMRHVSPYILETLEPTYESRVAAKAKYG